MGKAMRIIGIVLAFAATPVLAQPLPAPASYLSAGCR
jgi:hypothetical protein